MERYCKRCNRGTERNALNKRCIPCKQRLDAEAWTRKKEKLQDSEQARKEYNQAALEKYKIRRDRERVANRHNMEVV